MDAAQKAGYFNVGDRFDLSVRNGEYRSLLAMLDSPWCERLIVAGAVVLLHFLFAGWILQPQPPHIAVNEMSIHWYRGCLARRIGLQLFLASFEGARD